VVFLFKKISVQSGVTSGLRGTKSKGDLIDYLEMLPFDSAQGEKLKL